MLALWMNKVAGVCFVVFATAAAGLIAFGILQWLQISTMNPVTPIASGFLFLAAAGAIAFALYYRTFREKGGLL